MRTRPLVVTEWQVGTKSLDEKGTLIRIVGRQSGIISWLLTKFGIDPAFRFTVSQSKLEFSATSILRGRENRLIPIQNVCSTYYRYRLPFLESIFTFVVFFLSINALALPMNPFDSATLRVLFGIIVLILALFTGYILAKLVVKLNRTLTICVAETSGIVSGFSIKKSMIEGIDISDAQAKIVCELIESLMDAKRAVSQDSTKAKSPSQPSDKKDFQMPQASAPKDDKPSGKSNYASQEKEFKPKTNDYLSDHHAYNQKLKQAGLSADVDSNMPTMTQFLKIENGAIHFACGYCKLNMEIDITAGGQEIKCPECGEKQKVPTS